MEFHDEIWWLKAIMPVGRYDIGGRCIVWYISGSKICVERSEYSVLIRFTN